MNLTHVNDLFLLVSSCFLEHDNANEQPYADQSAYEQRRGHGDGVFDVRKVVQYRVVFLCKGQDEDPHRIEEKKS